MITVSCIKQTFLLTFGLISLLVRPTKNSRPKLLTKILQIFYMNKRKVSLNVEIHVYVHCKMK